MPRSPMHPDRRLEIALSATAGRLAREGALDGDAVAELRDLAAGRADLLAVAAGQALGGYLARPGATTPATVKAAALLIAAGADPDLIAAEVDATRLRSARTHGTHTTGGPPNGEAGFGR